MSIFDKTQGPDRKPTSEPERPRQAPRQEADKPRARAGGAPPRPGQGRSVLGSGCRLEGKVAGSGSLECRGRLEGEVSLDGDVVIGEGGDVKARVSARRVTVSGSLEGDALGREKVEVGSTGKMQGDIRSPSVSFAEGAFFEGNVEMRSVEEEPEGDSGDAPEVDGRDGPKADGGEGPKTDGGEGPKAGAGPKGAGEEEGGGGER